MDKSIIEDKGINAVYEYLASIGYIKPYLDRNDKTPLWDGTLFVYKNKDDFKNDNFDYRVPVQVKSSEYNGNAFPTTTTYSIEVTDLINYLNDGGLVFFKVLVNKSGNHVYCNFLTKAVIGNLLKDSNGQKTKTINLPLAPTVGGVVLECLRRINLQKQYQMVDLGVLNNKTNFKISLQINNLPINANPFAYLARHYNDFLFTYDDLPVYFYPKGGPAKLFIVETINKKVNVGNTTYYHYFTRTYKEDGFVISLGTCFSMTIPYETDKPFNIHFNIEPKANTLDGLIYELEFIHALYKNKSIRFGKTLFKVPGMEEIKESFAQWEKALQFWKNVKKMLMIIHAPTTINPHSFDDTDTKHLSTLIQAFVYNKPVYCDAGKDLMYDFEIGELHLFVYAKFIQGREYKLFDIYDKMATAYNDDNGIQRVSPLYSVLFEMEYMPTNLYLHNIVSEYKSFKKHNDHIELRANQDLLNMLKHYDQTKNKSILDAALEIATWLKNEKNSVIENKNLLLLNYLQTIKRKNGELTDAEKHKLNNLKTTDNTENFARFVLLGEKKKAQTYFDRIPENDAAFLKTLPIYFFMNN